MISDCEQLASYIEAEITSRVDIAVIGLSGGADSALTAILSLNALGPDSVYGLSMPYNQTDADTFNSLSVKLADKLGINHLVRPVSEIADGINARAGTTEDCDLTDVNKGNARSRARMCVLYGAAHDLSTRFPDRRVRVMGTGNLSEDFIGYDTKGGDALADIFPIGQLYKSEVYQLLDFFRDKSVIDESHIDRTPSAGLEDNQTDEQDLGYSYDEMEQGIRYCLDHYDNMEGRDLTEVTSFVWERHLAQKHKHEAPVIVAARHMCS